MRLTSKTRLVPGVSNRRFQRHVWCQTCRIGAVKAVDFPPEIHVAIRELAY